MKNHIQLILFSSTLVFSFTASGRADQAGCVDISGKYRPPYETASSDVVTTVIYSQYNCETLNITGMALGNNFHEDETRVYGDQELGLEGQPAPKGLDCVYNGYPGICASYLARPNYITKTTEMPGIVPIDNQGGACFYKVSHLFKDKNGNLIEQPVLPTVCPVGFSGAVPAITWPKASE